MTNKILSLALAAQAGTLVFLISKPEPKQVLLKPKKLVVQTIKVEKPTPVIVPEVKKIVVATKKSTHKFNFTIPKRRVITQGNSDKLLALSKEINAMGTLGEAFMENPIIQMGMEKRVRDQLQKFYGDFIRKANLTPAEQQALFQVLSETTQNNVKSMMSAMGDNMQAMRGMGENGFSPELMAGIRDNNLAMKESLLGSMGDEKFAQFEQYHVEKSAAQRYEKMERRLNSREAPLEGEQKEAMRELVLENQPSPFAESTYQQDLNKDGLNKGADSVLDEKQVDIINGSRRNGLSGTLMLPW